MARIAALLIVTALAACGPSAPPSSQPFYVCEAGEEGCAKKVENKGNGNGNKDGDTQAAPLVKGPHEPQETPPTKQPPGPPAPPGTPPPSTQAHGPLCTALAACCTNLRVAGITGSANQCDRTVADNGETACSTANDEYRTPDENYDPVCF